MAMTTAQMVGAACVLIAILGLIYYYYESIYVPAQTLAGSVTTAAGTTPATISIPSTTIGSSGSTTVPATVSTATGSAVVPVTLTASGVDFATASLSCAAGNITVNSATYAGGSCAGADNTAQVAALCNGHPSCTINILPSSMKMANGQPGSLASPDPCPNVKKTLNVGYTCA